MIDPLLAEQATQAAGASNDNAFNLLNLGASVALVILGNVFTLLTMQGRTATKASLSQNDIKHLADGYGKIEGALAKIETKVDILDNRVDGMERNWSRLEGYFEGLSKTK